MRKRNFLGSARRDTTWQEKRYRLPICCLKRYLCGSLVPAHGAILEDLLGEQNYTLQSFSHLVQISDFSVTKTLVQDGLGISFVYAPVAKKELEEGSLARIDWEQGHVWREI